MLLCILFQYVQVFGLKLSGSSSLSFNNNPYFVVVKMPGRLIKKEAHGDTGFSLREYIGTKNEENEEMVDVSSIADFLGDPKQFLLKNISKLLL